MKRYLHIFIIGIFFLSYFIFKKENNIDTNAIIEKTYDKNLSNLAKSSVTEKVSSETTQLTNNIEKKDQNTIIKNELLSRKIPDSSLSDIEKIKSCGICLSKISEKIISNELSREEMVNLLNSLTSENHPEIAKMLLETLSQILTQEGYSERSDLILSALANFNSPEVANILSEHLIGLSTNGNPNNFVALQDTLRKIIRQTTDSHQVGSNLAQAFFSANTPQAQEQILAINHLDTLVQISVESLNQGDITTFQAVTNRLQQNNSQTTPDAILSLYRKQADTNYQAEALMNLAKAWAQKNAIGASLDILEEKLTSGTLPEGEQALVLSMLEHSIDPRGKSIIEKYRSNSQ